MLRNRKWDCGKRRIRATAQEGVLSLFTATHWSQATRADQTRRVGWSWLTDCPLPGWGTPMDIRKVNAQPRTEGMAERGARLVGNGVSPLLIGKIKG